tara:strand:+ start:430 stop:636 length:207 start_codon:yes stop_codon:yes gene_type:complete
VLKDKMIDYCEECSKKIDMSKMELGNKIIKKLEPNKSDKEISELRYTILYGLKKKGLEYLYRKLYKIN